jgi:predicted amidophosphoribosyltransferase
MPPWQESPMTRTWTVCRQPSPHRDGERRWDQAYQLLVRWAERSDLPLAGADRRGGA